MVIVLSNCQRNLIVADLLLNILRQPHLHHNVEIQEIGSFEGDCFSFNMPLYDLREIPGGDGKIKAFFVNL